MIDRFFHTSASPSPSSKGLHQYGNWCILISTTSIPFLLSAMSMIPKCQEFVTLFSCGLSGTTSCIQDEVRVSIIVLFNYGYLLSSPPKQKMELVVSWWCIVRHPRPLMHPAPPVYKLHRFFASRWYLHNGSRPLNHWTKLVLEGRRSGSFLL